MQANRKRRRLSDKSIINAATLVNAMSRRFFWLTLRTRWENIEANRLHMLLRHRIAGQDTRHATELTEQLSPRSQHAVAIVVEDGALH